MRKTCKHVDEATGEPCGSSAEGKTDFCVAHGVGRRCQHVDEASGEPCGRSAVGKTDFCTAHGGGRRCQHVDEAGEPCGSSAQGKTDFCIAHGGGFRCSRADVHHLDEVPPPAYYRGEDDARLCWGCLAALYPERAKLKVRKEHFVLGELHRQVRALDSAETVEWDCPFPGGCSLKQPDHLYAWPERYLDVEVDEEGHAGEDEDSRLEIIAADLGRPGLVVRINPDFKGQQCFRKVQLSNGEN